MPYDEFLGWINYFERRPAEWRADDRAFKLMQVQGCKEKAYNVFPSLASIYKPPTPAGKGDGNIAVSNFKGSVMFAKLLDAKGGEKLDIW